MILWGGCLRCTCRQGCRVNQPESYRKWFSCPDNPGPTFAAKLLVTSISGIGTWGASFLSCQLHRHVGPSSDLRTKFWRSEVSCKLALRFFFPWQLGATLTKSGLLQGNDCHRFSFDEGLALRRWSTMRPVRWAGDSGRSSPPVPWFGIGYPTHGKRNDTHGKSSLPPAEAAVDTNPMQLVTELPQGAYTSTPTETEMKEPEMTTLTHKKDWRQSNLTFRFSLRSARRCDGMREKRGRGKS